MEVKLCECGCGQPAPIAKCTRRGYVKGQPLRFIRGHQPGPVKHGGTGTPEYHAYMGAKSRCTNPEHAAWEDYGGRGIEFRFITFEEFFAELGPRPEGMSLDRKDDNGHYEVGNVRWATPIEQANNRRPRTKAA